MTRLVYGGGLADWTFAADDANLAEVIGGAVIKFYDAESGGTRWIDLQDLNGIAIDQVVSSAGDDGRSLGQIPAFYGPDNIFEMWASANDGPRALVTAVNLGSYLGPVREQLSAHLAPSAKNPHYTMLTDLADVDGDSFTGVPTGSTVVLGAGGLFVAGSAVSGGGSFDAAADQTLTGTWTFNTPAGDGGAPRAVLNAAATGQTADLFTAFSGTDTGQGGTRQRTTYLNEKGELRAIAAKTNSVAARFKGQPGQAANIVEITDTGNTPRAWFGPNYGLYAPNSGFPLQWADEGDIAIGAGLFGWVNDFDVDVSIRSFRASLVTPYASGSLVLVLKTVLAAGAGATTEVFTVGNRPTITATTKTTGKLTNMTNPVIPVGAMLLLDVQAIGAGNVGKNLFAQAMVW